MFVKLSIVSYDSSVVFGCGSLLQRGFSPGMLAGLATERLHGQHHSVSPAKITRNSKVRQSARSLRTTRNDSESESQGLRGMQKRSSQKLPVSSDLFRLT